MNIKINKNFNRVKAQHFKMVRNLNTRLKTLNLQNHEDFKLYINILNQIYFLNNIYNEAEVKIRDINTSLKKSEPKNINKQIEEDKRINESIDKFKPLIFLHYHISGVVSDLN